MNCIPYPSTFSIVAHDPTAEEWGVAVRGVQDAN